ncbi:STAS domain-containing protein [Streptomyces roseus]|uniref:STAS domain-containing protein n=1 Tax=Streptomyces roseus TaxID=66430 RepID=UPI0033D23590
MSSCSCQAEAECVPGDGHTLVRLSGEFDADTVHVFREVLEATGEATDLVVDLSSVTFADTSLLHALLDARKRVVLAGPLPRQFHRILDLTGLVQLFAAASDVDAASRSFSG